MRDLAFFRGDFRDFSRKYGRESGTFQLRVGAGFRVFIGLVRVRVIGLCSTLDSRLCRCVDERQKDRQPSIRGLRPEKGTQSSQQDWHRVWSVCTFGVPSHYSHLVPFRRTRNSSQQTSALLDSDFIVQ